MGLECGCWDYEAEGLAILQKLSATSCPGDTAQFCDYPILTAGTLPAVVCWVDRSVALATSLILGSSGARRFLL